jgi:hypothetical protein
MDFRHLTDEIVSESPLDSSKSGTLLDWPEGKKPFAIKIIELWI